MLTSYDQSLDACRELCRAQMELYTTALQDAARVNAAGRKLIENYLARQEDAAERIDDAATLEDLFDVSANLIGEGISSGTQTVLQMWQEIGEVQARSLNYLPAHAQRLSGLYGRMFQFLGGFPQPLIPLGSLLFGGLPVPGAAASRGKHGNAGARAERRNLNEPVIPGKAAG